MKLPTKATVAAVALGALAAPGAAYAQMIELGATKTPVTAPACPATTPKGSLCALSATRSTLLSTIRDRVIYPTTVTKEGWLVAFTLGLSPLTSSRTDRKSFIHQLDQLYGGVPQARITVVRRQKGVSHGWTVISQSQPVRLIPYLGQVVQFPLVTRLHVLPGDAVALTVPTWAPVLSVNQSNSAFAYRQSRSGTKAQCDKPAPTQTAQTVIGQSTQYLCDYTGTGVEYSATEVTEPTVTPNFVHTRRR
jgi:hypothetical protein